MIISNPKNNQTSCLKSLSEKSNIQMDHQFEYAKRVSDLQLCSANIMRRHIVYSKKENVYEFESLYSDNSYMRIILCLNADHSRLNKINNNIQYIKFDVCNLIICSSEMSLEYSIDPFQEIIFYEIILEGEWMKNEAKKIFPSSNIEESSKFLKEIVLWDKCNSSIWKKVETSIKEMETTLYNDISLNNELCVFMAQNIYRKVIQQTSPVFPGSEVHIEKLMKVKQVLLNHLNMPLPNLSEIAVQVTLSESTLKRHFKNVFGKSVYDYYLEKKMEYARQILLDEPLTVNEIAERLGYEKVSNFIEIFKKRYGVSPGNIKKKTALKKVDLV